MSSYSNNGTTVQAGAISSEALTSSRTVIAFGLEDSFLDRYANKLREATKIGVIKGKTVGLGIGATLFFIFLSYGVAFWFGSYLVVTGRMTAGKVTTVFFAVIQGIWTPRVHPLYVYM